MASQILVINPGSTSTKLALYSDERELFSESRSHSTAELAHYPTPADQTSFRRATIEGFLADHAVDPTSLSAVIGRGGLLRPLAGGVYSVSDQMVQDLQSGRYGLHASNLGGILARSIAEAAGCPAYIADPVVVDELSEEAKLSGVPELPRKSIFHALNQKSAAREACRRLGIRYEGAKLIVAHLGGGISVGAHRLGCVVDVNNALDGEGPFSPERAGTVPAGQLAELCFSGRYSLAETKRMLTGGGGLVAYRGTNDVRAVVADSDAGDAEASRVLESMCYQIAKEIAALGAAFGGEIDAIVLTGGIAYEESVVRRITERVAYLAQIIVIPGERELLSLAAAALGALRGEREVLTYE